MIIRLVLALAVIFGAGIQEPVAIAQVQNAPVTAQKITHFNRNTPNQTRFGTLKFVGGLVLRSKNSHFGAISGMRISKDGILTAVADTGFWFQGRLQRNLDGIPTGISNGRIAPVLDTRGKPFQHKWSADVEGLTFVGKTAYVSTEMDMRVLRFDPESELMLAPSIRVTPTFSHPSIDQSFAFESIATLPDQHPLSPGVLIFAETDSSGKGKAPGFILVGEQRLPIFIKLSDGMFITDADFLPNGDLVVLERRYSLSHGVLMRIRRIAGADIKEGAMLEGDVMVEAGPDHVIDNMEALSVFKGPLGDIRIAIMSDDNHWLMQRTIYLEFSLVDN